jgi:hypothetical protein
MLLTGLILVVGDGMGVLSLDHIRGLWPISLILVGALELPSSKKQGN